MTSDHICNPSALEMARAVLRQSFKSAFVPVGDPALSDPAAAGMGAGPPGGDPAAGGMPPPGMDPAAAGGAPPPAPPPPDAGGGGDLLQVIMQKLDALASGGGAAGGMGGPAGAPKMKIDVNVELVQIKKMLAKITDYLGIPISASEMTVTPQDIVNMQQNPQQALQQSVAAPAPQPGGAPPGGAPPGGAPPGGGEVKAGWVGDNGKAVPVSEMLQEQSNQAQAIMGLFRSAA